MKYWKFKGLLQNDGWLTPAFVSLDEDGRVESISQTTPKVQSTEITDVKGFVLPGFQNAHSHAFQYAMAGLAELHPDGKKGDNFWTWREKMYRIALEISPEQLEDIATMLYAEMLRHGYTQVAEFHYLHHNQDGKPYDNLAELGGRLVSAAANAGIKITLVPMFYQSGGFDQKPESHQRRFISPTIDDYWKLLESSEMAVDKSSHATLGYGVHSLRAVHDSELRATFAEGPTDLPRHIHIAEQLKEVDDCLLFSGKRPVEYLFDQVSVNERFHLVHATHLNDDEVKLITSFGAHVVLCPTTEGNLGDGLFRFRDFKTQNGNWSIGTDSHIGISPLEELRLLDYGQRLISHDRDTFVENDGDSGRYAFHQALIGGRKAMGNDTQDYFGTRQPFDAVVFDGEAPLLVTSDPSVLLSSIIYSSDPTHILGTIVDGKWAWQNQDTNRHLAQFLKSMKQLAIR